MSDTSTNLGVDERTGLLTPMSIRFVLALGADVLRLATCMGVQLPLRLRLLRLRLLLSG